MLEKDIENLIARYPSEFFPNEKFTLQGQQVKLGQCRADILFVDNHDRKIIVEVKRGILSREAAGQVMDYYGLLKEIQPDAVIELIVCANTIPHERRVFLENAGIELKELGLSLIQRIAAKYNYKFLDDRKEQDDKILPANSSKINTDVCQTEGSLSSTWLFQANPDRYDILNALSDPEVQRYHWQVNQHIKKIKKGDIALIWMSGKEGGIYAVAEILCAPAIMREYPAEEKYWVSDEDKGVECLRVELVNKIVLMNTPIYRDELKAMEELKNLSILRIAQGTNFPVSAAEWHVIKKLMDDKIASRH